MKIVPAILVSVAMLCVVGWQKHTLVQLKNENAVLSSDASEARGLMAKISAMPDQPTADITNELESLRNETHQLLKLRNEVQQLRGQKSELEALRAENARLKSIKPQAAAQPRQVPIQPIRVAIRSLSNQGLHTPDAAVQTFFWAWREGDITWLSRCISNPRLADGKEMAENFAQRFRSPDAHIEIVARQDISTTTVQIGIVLQFNVAWKQKGIITAQLNGTEWQVDANPMEF